jgi:perosamine synthetase
MIPISKPNISKLEVDYVNQAMESGWISSLGTFISKFEERFAQYCGVKYAIAVSNGTVGLHLALEVLGVGGDDEVIIPDLTFVATANAVRMAGATPVTVDVLKTTYCIDPKKIEDAITPRTKAIIPVHLYGHPADMIEIQRIASEHKLFLIEDAAEAHGASIGERRVGSFGDCGVFSFYGNKIITTGEGGMITTNSKDTYERARFLRDHAMSQERKYWHTSVGFNYRMTNIQAAIGLAQMQKIDDFIEERDEILEKYKERLSDLPLSFNPSVNARPVNWFVCAKINGGGRKNTAIKSARKIATPPIRGTL